MPNLLKRDKMPSPLSFPKSFNPNAVDQWFAACDALPNDPHDAWVQSTKRFAEGCKKVGIKPFVQPPSPNFAIRSYLLKRRHEFVLFLNFTKLMVGLPVIRLITKKAYVESFGFSIVLDAQVRIEDPTWYRKLTRFRPPYHFGLLREKGRFVLHLNPGLSIYVYNPVGLHANTWHIGYEVKCPVHPDYEGLDYNKQAFILDHLWKPLTTTYRPSKVDRINYL